MCSSFAPTSQKSQKVFRSSLGRWLVTTNPTTAGWRPGLRSRRDGKTCGGTWWAVWCQLHRLHVPVPVAMPWKKTILMGSGFCPHVFFLFRWLLQLKSKSWYPCPHGDISYPHFSMAIVLMILDAYMTEGANIRLNQSSQNGIQDDTGNICKKNTGNTWCFKNWMFLGRFFLQPIH